MRKSIFIILTSILILSDSCAVQKKTGTMVRLETMYGDIIIKLYPETKNHHDNFVKLVNAGFYNGILFHRVIANFMIQAGDPDSKNSKAGASLGSGDVGYTIPSEFIYPKYYHKRGALAAARQGDNSNPLKASSGCQFYIVEGKTFTDTALDSIESVNKQKLEGNLFRKIANNRKAEIEKYRIERNQPKLDALRDSILAVVKVDIEKNTSYKFTERQRIDYKTIGGTPHLDGEYTVFGEVTKGIEIVEKISKAKTGSNDRPIEDIKVIKAKIIK